ncbi:hypothetical protein SeLEV6574_g04964 [Synchytrium endobioticum]|nr:hypothetical protein SeLEV6574_g04957 [Synchytrium endobioticum]TPX43594.1 hypothetical protein SeLEV6574_g04964 [Synchytrium endobioticum]
MVFKKPSIIYWMGVMLLLTILGHNSILTSPVPGKPRRSSRLMTQQEPQPPAAPAQTVVDQGDHCDQTLVNQAAAITKKLGELLAESKAPRASVGNARERLEQIYAQAEYLRAQIEGVTPPVGPGVDPMGTPDGISSSCTSRGAVHASPSMGAASGSRVTRSRSAAANRLTNR